MARRRRHRRYGSVTSVNLSGLTDIFKGNVAPMDVGVGVLVGLFGSALLKGAIKQFSPTTYASLTTPDATGNVPILGKLLPAIFGFSAGAIAYYAEKQTTRAAGHALGATIAGTAVAAWDYAKTAFTGVPLLDFSSVTSVNLGGWGFLPSAVATQNFVSGRTPMNGLLVSDHSDGSGGLNGLLVADHSDGLAELAGLSMGADDDGIESLMGM